MYECDVIEDCEAVATASRRPSVSVLRVIVTPMARGFNCPKTQAMDKCRHPEVQ